MIIMIPEMPAFPGDLSAQGGLKAIMAAQYKSINRGGDSIMVRRTLALHTTRSPL